MPSLFPEIIPVSELEVSEWLNNIPNLSALPSRREAYRKAYNIEEKIRAAKNDGHWPNQANQNLVPPG